MRGLVGGVSRRGRGRSSWSLRYRRDQECENQSPLSQHRGLHRGILQYLAGHRAGILHEGRQQMETGDVTARPDQILRPPEGGFALLVAVNAPTSLIVVPSPYSLPHLPAQSVLRRARSREHICHSVSLRQKGLAGLGERCWRPPARHLVEATDANQELIISDEFVPGCHGLARRNLPGQSYTDREFPHGHRPGIRSSRYLHKLDS